MSAVRATWVNGQILPIGPVDWPEGSELVVQPVVKPFEKLGMDESEWRDDPKAIADWIAWLKTIEPLEYTEEERAEMEKYDEEFRQFNLQAVRQQMGLSETP
jgi:hypothetical protein